MSSQLGGKQALVSRRSSAPRRRQLQCTPCVQESSQQLGNMCQMTATANGRPEVAVELVGQ